MSNFLNGLCSSVFMPHGQCYLWNPNLITLHAVSDGLIGAAYYSIPLIILYFLRRRPDLPFPHIFILFGAFILACGTTHLIEVWTIWRPHYWISGGVKAITAGVSIVTAFALIRVFPMALGIPSVRALQSQNVVLEERVRERTAELTRANAELVEHVRLHEIAKAEVALLNEKLQVRLAEFQTIFDLVPIGIGIISDPKTREVRTNPALSRMMGINQDAKSFVERASDGPPPFRIVEGGRDLRREEFPLQRVVSGQGAVVDCEQTIVRADGTALPVLVSAVPISDTEGCVIGAVSTAIDLTQRKKLEAERLDLERKLQETQKLESLGVMAGGIAHDFNNLLTGILGNSTLASMEVAPTSPIQENLNLINQAAIRAADLCKQMLAYAGRGKFIVQRLDINTVLEDTTHLLQISISKKAVLRFELTPGLPPINADPTQLRQVVMNLVINASEAIGDKSGVISIRSGLTRIDHAYLGGTLAAPDIREGDYVSMEISDSGSGMSPETQAKIFDPFFTTKFSGRGLGLAAVLGIVRGHNGALKVYSEPGRGTTFKLLFPAAEGVAEASRPSPGPAGLFKGSGKILVVDDEETIRSTLARMLRAMGFEVALAADGREGVKAFAEDSGGYRLVLMDLTMPHLDGASAFAELRRIRPSVRVVLMSGFNEYEAVANFAGKGLASFLQKPFNMDALVEALRTAL